MRCAYIDRLFESKLGETSSGNFPSECLTSGSFSQNRNPFQTDTSREMRLAKDMISQSDSFPGIVPCMHEFDTRTATKLTPI